MALLVCVLAVSLLTVGLAGPTLAADSSVECAAGSGGGPVYVTDSGLEVADNATAADESYPAFPDAETVSLEDVNVSFSAAGPADLRLEERSADFTCVAAVNASANDVLIGPAEGPGMTINGSLEALSFGPLDFESDDAADLTYDANDSVTLTIDDTGLDEGETVAFESLGSDTIDAEVDADSNGTFSVELPAGDYELALSTASSGGGLPGLPPPPPDDEPAAFEYSEIALESTEIGAGEEITVSATATNVGEASGSHTVELLVNGEVVGEESVYLAGGSSETITFTTVLDDAGTTGISLGDESVGTVTVTDEEPGSDNSGGTDPGSDDDGEATPDPESEIDEGSETPWLLITIGLLAIVTAGVGVAYSQGHLDPYLSE
ncbi:CARDB domain-containing protein [Halovivax ruber]|uniref:CARDB domain-containing protein n=1 Tax=Halovivax ruber TaxID=387341 RepID=UPI0011E54BE8|nr:CARDB domain-containing protein [Halovivax ruber]